MIATKWTTAANAIFLQYSGVVWVLLLSPLVLKEPFRARDAAAVAVAFGGHGALLRRPLRARGARGRRDRARSRASSSPALVLSLRRERGVGAEAVVTWGNVARPRWRSCRSSRADLSLSAASAAILLFLGVFQIAGAYALFVRGHPARHGDQASLLGMLEPIANPIWVFLFLGETPGPLSLARRRDRARRDRVADADRTAAEPVRRRTEVRSLVKSLVLVTRA